MQDGSKSPVAGAFEGITTAAVLCAAVLVIFNNSFGRDAKPLRNAAVQRVSDISIDVSRTPLLGDASAAIGIVMFSDFECPYCRSFALDTLPLLKTEFVDAGEAQILFKHFPLESIHQNARHLAGC